MLPNLLTGNFLSGYKTYIVLWGGVVITWLSFATGTSLACEWSAAVDCVAPTLQDSLNVSWAALAGMFLRKGVGK